MKTKKKLNKQLIITTIIFIVFIVYSILVKLNVFNKIDSSVESFVIGIRQNNLTKIFSIITNLGSATALIAITLVILLVAIIKHHRLPISTMINLPSIFIINEITKAIIRRPRPTGIHLVEATGFSYPSGHTIVSLAFYGFIMKSLCERIKNKSLKIIINIMGITLIILISLSRIYLGVHYLTDIIAGYILGTTYLILFLYIRKKYLKRNQKWKP